MTALNAPSRESFNCSFCHKSNHDVRVMIAGPRYAYICDECVRLSMEIVTEKDWYAKHSAYLDQEYGPTLQGSAA